MEQQGCVAKSHHQAQTQIALQARLGSYACLQVERSRHVQRHQSAQPGECSNRNGHGSQDALHVPVWFWAKSEREYMEFKATRYRGLPPTGVHDHLLDSWVIGIGGVATATVVQQVRLVVGVQHVVHLIVNASEGQDIWVIITTCKHVLAISGISASYG